MKLSLDIPGNRRKIGEILVEKRLITEDQLNMALALQRLTGSNQRLGTLLVEQGTITRADFMKALTKQLGVVRGFSG